MASAVLPDGSAAINHALAGLTGVLHRRRRAPGRSFAQAGDLVVGSSYPEARSRGSMWPPIQTLWSLEAWTIFGRSLPPSKLRRLRSQQSVDVCISRSTTASRPSQRACGSASCRLGAASCINASICYVNLSGYHQARREHRLTRPFQERKLAKACSASLTASKTPGSEPCPRSQTNQNI
jgi:hypothetical protein